MEGGVTGLGGGRERKYDVEGVGGGRGGRWGGGGRGEGGGNAPHPQLHG